MTTVRIEEELFSVREPKGAIKDQQGTVKIDIIGHAEYANENDIVCSAISILTYTLMQRLQDLDGVNAFKRYECTCKAGEVHICVLPKRESKRDFYTMLNTIIRGYQLLNNKYPENISVKKVGWGRF